jgi:hypothetical protein
MAIEPGGNQGIDVQSLMREVRSRARARNRDEQRIPNLVRNSIPPRLTASVAQFREALPRLRGEISQVGVVPPTPPSLRGRIGRVVIHLIQKALFWLIPPLNSAHRELVAALEQQARANDEILALLERTLVELETMRESSQGAGPRSDAS